MATTKANDQIREATPAIAGTVDQASRSPSSCWSCGDMRAAHFCQQCGKVQPPAPVDYFTFFGLPYKLNLDTGATGARFLRAKPPAASRHQRASQRRRSKIWSLEKELRSSTTLIAP